MQESHSGLRLHFTQGSSFGLPLGSVGLRD
jgi:hypothetical protein